MFDISKRGSGRQEGSVDDELEQDRLGSAPRAGSPAAAAPAASSSPGARVREAAIIGPSIHINGDLRGEEDLVIEGTVSGTIHLQDNGLTVGSNGKVRAEVHAKSIVVDGTLEGDLYGSERVAIRKSGEVRGNIVSPRVSLDDGGRFKGTVEMDQEAVDKAFGTSGRGSRASGPARDDAAGGTATAKESGSGEAAAGSGATGSAAAGSGSSSGSSGSAAGSTSPGKGGESSASAAGGKR